jgi:hypothetical protein
MKSAVAAITSGAASLVIGATMLMASWGTSPPEAHAAVEGWHPGSSWFPHAGWSIPTKRIGSMTGTGWNTPYNNAISSWNATFTSFNPFNAVGQQSSALIHIVEADSSDEHILDALKSAWEGRTSQGTCVQYGQPTDWAIVLVYYGNDIYPHYGDHKICVWPGRIAQGYNYLTIKHELGHVLGFGDDTDGDACLFKSGTSMVEVCSSEINWIKAHIGRQ